MGTYTTNYQLYMPTVGETGWGTLVNGNFTTIDSTMKSLSNRITAVENEVNGALNCTSVTTSGKITGNSGIVGTTGTFSEAVTGATGVFYGNVTATNINKLGLIPYTLYLLDTTSLINYVYSVVPSYLSSSINAGSYYNHTASSPSSIPAKSQKTFYSLIGLSNDVPATINNIVRTDNSWSSATISTNIEGFNAKIEGLNLDITYTPQNISDEIACNLLSNRQKITFTNTTSYNNNGYIQIKFRNNSSSNKMVVIANNGLYP